VRGTQVPRIVALSVNEVRHLLNTEDAGVDKFILLGKVSKETLGFGVWSTDGGPSDGCPGRPGIDPCHR
jgi:hypothetical protein